MLYLTESKKGGTPAKALLEKIIRFKPVTDNTIDNFLPSNALITAMALTRTNGKDQAKQWLNQQATTFPQYKSVFEWSGKVLDGENIADIPESKRDSNLNILTALQKAGLL